MNINTDSMTPVTDVNNRKSTADLKYSETTERWTINSSVQKTLDLYDNQGFNMFTALGEDGQRLILLEVVDSDDAEMFTGKTPSFTARKLRTLVDNIMDGENELALEPVDNEDNFFVIQAWTGESAILEQVVSFDEEQEVEEQEETVLVEEQPSQNEEVEPEFSVSNNW